MNKTRHQQFKEICREFGWKCTAQRLAVFSIVHENYSHPGVDDIWAEVRKTMPSVTRESVYRILTEFSGRGLVHRLDHIDTARYDWQVGPHGHFICTRCGAIQDFPLSKAIAVPPKAFDGDVDHMEIRLCGICSQCSKQKTGNNKPNSKTKKGTTK